MNVSPEVILTKTTISNPARTNELFTSSLYYLEKATRLRLFSATVITNKQHGYAVWVCCSLAETSTILETLFRKGFP